MRTIYAKYKERLIEISGRNRSLYLRRIVKKYSYDLGRCWKSPTTTKNFKAFYGKRKGLLR